MGSIHLLGVCSYQTAPTGAPLRKKSIRAEKSNMKAKILVSLMAAVLVTGSTITTAFGQNGPSTSNACCWGGPPKTAEERAARQAWCAQNCPNPGPCVTGQPRGWGFGRGQGAMNGAGRGFRRGLRDGTGPRAAAGTCPLTKPAPATK